MTDMTDAEIAEIKERLLVAEVARQGATIKSLRRMCKLFADRLIEIRELCVDKESHEYYWDGDGERVGPEITAEQAAQQGATQ